MIQVARYQQVFARRAFRLFWGGFTLSVLGDTMSRVALTWFVYDLTNSPAALGLLALTYTGPVIVGGLVAGWLLDRFDRRKILIADNLIRGSLFALIPVLQAAGVLQLWHVYAISTVFGSLMMISLAGSPSLLPDLVDEQQLATANALETLSYTLSGTVGPLVAGFLIPVIGAANVVLLDAGSYLLFAGLLGLMPAIQPRQADSADQTTSYRLTDSIRLLLGKPILLSTTIMFMLFNLGFGALLVWLPILADQTLSGGAELFGVLLGALALGELVSSTLVGTLDLRWPLGRLIGLTQACSGIALGGLLLSLSAPVALVSLFLLGFFSAPMTILAQTLRMQIIPAQLRGRTFALLRMLMQGALPLGGVAAGFILPLVAMSTMIGLSAAVIGLPGLVGTRVSALWHSAWGVDE